MNKTDSRYSGHHMRGNLLPQLQSDGRVPVLCI